MSAEIYRDRSWRPFPVVMNLSEKRNIVSIDRKKSVELHPWRSVGTLSAVSSPATGIIVKERHSYIAKGGCSGKGWNRWDHPTCHVPTGVQVRILMPEKRFFDGISRRANATFTVNIPKRLEIDGNKLNPLARVCLFSMGKNNVPRYFIGTLF